MDPAGILLHGTVPNAETTTEEGAPAPAPPSKQKSSPSPAASPRNRGRKRRRDNDDADAYEPDAESSESSPDREEEAGDGTTSRKSKKPRRELKQHQRERRQTDESAVNKQEQDSPRSNVSVEIARVATTMSSPRSAIRKGAPTAAARDDNDGQLRIDAAKKQRKWWKLGIFGKKG
jgi:hypothetical protein